MTSASISLDANAPPSDGPDDANIAHTVLTIAREGFATVPAMRFPILLLLVALALGMTVGKVTIIPTGSRRRSGTGLVRSFDAEGGYGLIVPTGGGRDVFVHAAALDGSEALQVGDRVEYVAVDMKNRSIATRVRRISPA